MKLSLSTALLIPACLLSQVLASPTVGIRTISRRSDEPLAPLQDPWYNAPDGFEKTAPGTVLRIREAPGNLTSLVTNASAAYNILYRTTNSRYKPDWAVTTVFVPTTKTPALLSYQIPYDSVFLDASPSYVLYSDDSTNYHTDISTGLASGWFVNVPDYEGPLASFTAGVQSGHATIDSVRAIQALNGTLGLATGARTALWGYSGGALASEWALELQVQYAPELNFTGAALGGLTTNITSVLLSINGGIAAGLAPSAILGQSSQHPEEYEYIISRLKTTGTHNATGFLATLNLTADEADVAFAFQDIGDYFIGGISDLTGSLAGAETDRDGIMGYHGVPQAPLFVYKAIADEISVVADTDELVERYCAVGANILYQRNTVGGHSAEYVNGHPAALTWLSSVLGGTYAQDYNTTGCITENVTVNITSTALRRRDVGGSAWTLHKGY
ncbi:hypothetical protein VPNG_08960 [Cytospora leucostoma]|uniref:Triacylglycerol lipase n=1 Tax=Cytospora leucostoma TaxID=1230097 RepID=A0A423VVZ7_9PEZI|nr:hypothetical protein VPNG_08960 [Cytospora leucostoma]